MSADEFGRIVWDNTQQGKDDPLSIEFGTIQNVTTAVRGDSTQVIALSVEVSNIRDLPNQVVTRWSSWFQRELNEALAAGTNTVVAPSFIGRQVELHFRGTVATVAYTVVSGG